jgi:hypothetical protein
MNTETPTMFRWQYFTIMGNNCRLQGMSQEEAQEVINCASESPGDGDNFWTGYHYGKQDFIEVLPRRSELWD